MKATLETLDNNMRVKGKIGTPLSVVGDFKGTASFNKAVGGFAARGPDFHVCVVVFDANFTSKSGWQYDHLEVLLPESLSRSGGTHPEDNPAAPDEEGSEVDGSERVHEAAPEDFRWGETLSIVGKPPSER